MERTKVAIVGFTESRKDAPYDDPEWEIWGLNNLHLYGIPRMDRWFDLHDLGTIRKDDKHTAWLRSTDVPVYMWDPQDEWPTAKPFPKAEVLANFKPYFTNSISWMIALAMLEGFESIGVWGVDMAQTCLAPETLVLTDDLRYVPQTDVKVGDYLLGFDEFPLDGQTYRQFRRTRVEEVQHHLQPCYRLTFASGAKIIASDDHPWLVHSSNTRRWLESEALSARPDRPSQIVKIGDTWVPDRSWGAGFLAAAMDAEGHLSGRSLGWAQRDNALARTFLAEARARGFEFRGQQDQTGCWKYQLVGGKREVLRFLAEIRPPRLLEGFSVDQLGSFHGKGAEQKAALVEKEFIGLHETIGLQTDTHTLVAEGLATHNTEYGAQRPSCEYYLGLAEGRGIEVIIAEQSDLLKSGSLYGAEDNSALRKKLEARDEELKAKLAEAEAAIEQAMGVRYQLMGAIESNTYIKNVWTMPEIQREQQETT